jgi:hypothetical protein
MPVSPVKGDRAVVSSLGTTHLFRDGRRARMDLVDRELNRTFVRSNDRK